MRHWRGSLASMAVAGMVVAMGITAAPAANATTGGEDASAAVGGLTSGPGPALPKNAVPGSTPERRAAWERATPAARQQAIARFQSLVGPRMQPELDRLRSRPASMSPAAGPTVTWARAVAGQAGAAVTGPAPTVRAAAPTFTRTAPPDAGRGGGQFLAFKDPDFDGLGQGFERGVADVFTPFYHVSANENAGTGFATFLNSTPQTVSGVFGSVPPISYFRVQPLGVGTDAAGTPVGVLRIDYLELWNRDDGFDTFGVCGAAISLVESLIGIEFVTGGHDLDNERGAALVAAPLSPSGGFNEDPNAYSIYSFYTAAHEGTFAGDNSAYAFFNPPVPANNHIVLQIARSKHSTYTFNPDWHPVIWPEIMAFTYFAIDDLYFAGLIDFETYLIFQYLADEAFFACIVEHFNEQGGFYAQTRIDVGEPGRSLNGAGFIEDTQSGINQKLTVPLW